MFNLAGNAISIDYQVPFGWDLEETENDGVQYYPRHRGFLDRIEKPV
jgi:hypothetical protein